MALLTKDEIELKIEELIVKLAEVALNGSDVSIKEEGSEFSIQNNLDDIKAALSMYRKMLRDLDTNVSTKRATRKRRADYE